MKMSIKEAVELVYSSNITSERAIEQIQNDAIKEGMVRTGKLIELANIAPQSKLNLLTQISVEMQLIDEMYKQKLQNE